MQSELFNLTDEAWIPVLFHDGKNRMVSLREVFSGDESIADLALNPYERIAVMRLLICIAMAARRRKHLKEETWRKCHPNLSVLLKYLSKWYDRFNLYGEHAFCNLMTSPPLKSKRGQAASHLASGSNNTQAITVRQRTTVKSAMLTWLWLVYLSEFLSGRTTFQVFRSQGNLGKCFAALPGKSMLIR